MEPQGNKSNDPPTVDGQKLRFVVLRHEGHGALHWDLMVEMPRLEGLATWRVGKPPEEWSGVIEGERIGDHRKVYLEYEGEVSNNRGRVVRVAEGEAVLRGGWIWLGERRIGWGG